MKPANKAKSQKRRMNALLQIALMRAVEVHGYSRPQIATCYQADRDGTVSFYFDSPDGRQVGGSGELLTSVSIHNHNRIIINYLLDSIRSVTGYAEYNYRRQVLASMQVALKAYPDQFTSIYTTAYLLL